MLQLHFLFSLHCCRCRRFFLVVVGVDTALNARQIGLERRADRQTRELRGRAQILLLQVRDLAIQRHNVLALRVSQSFGPRQLLAQRFVLREQWRNARDLDAQRRDFARHRSALRLEFERLQMQFGNEKLRDILEFSDCTSKNMVNVLLTFELNAVLYF